MTQTEEKEKVEPAEKKHKSLKLNGKELDGWDFTGPIATAFLLCICVLLLLILLCVTTPVSYAPYYARTYVRPCIHPARAK